MYVKLLNIVTNSHQFYNFTTAPTFLKHQPIAVFCLRVKFLQLTHSITYLLIIYEEEVIKQSINLLENNPL